MIVLGSIELVPSDLCVQPLALSLPVLMVAKRANICLNTYPSRDASVVSGTASYN